MSSPEQIVLRRFNDKIQEIASSTGTVHPFSSKLYANNIIDSKVHYAVTNPSLLSPFEKVGQILQGVDSKLKAERDDKSRAEVFDVFLEQMDEIIPLDSIAEQMRERYKQETAKAKAAKARAEKESTYVNHRHRNGGGGLGPTSWLLPCVPLL